MSIELEIDSKAEIILDADIEVINESDIEICTEEPDYEVSVTRKEYAIVGDSVFIAESYEESPPWLQELIDVTTAAGIAASIGDLTDLSNALTTLIAELDIAKNAYTQSIISSGDIDERILTAITTQNSTLGDSIATVLNIAQTKVTASEASVLAGEVLTASILDETTGNALGTLLASLQTAIVNSNSALATSIDIVNSSLQGGIDANASAATTLQTYVGVDANGDSTGLGLSGDVVANSTAITQLGIDLSDTNDAIISGNSAVTQTLTGIINGVETDLSGDITQLDTDLSGDITQLDTDLGNAVTQLNTDLSNAVIELEADWRYENDLTIGGTTYTTGFGLASSLTSGSGLTGSDSEFWIQADSFRFTAADDTKSGYTPFAVNATTGEVTFNGVVSFTNVQDAPIVGTNIVSNPLPAIGNETSGYIAGYTNTGHTIIVGPSWSTAYNPLGGSSVYSKAEGTCTNNEVFDIYALTDGSSSNGNFPVVQGEILDISCYAAAYRCKGAIGVLWRDANDVYIGAASSSSTITANTAGVPFDQMNRAQVFATVPAGAAYARIYIRGTVVGTQIGPYLFINHVSCFKVNSTDVVSTFADNAGYNAANVINTNTTTINGGKLTTNSVTALHIDASTMTLDNLNIGGTDTLGNFDILVNTTSNFGILGKAAYGGVVGDVSSTSAASYGVRGSANTGIGVRGSSTGGIGGRFTTSKSNGQWAVYADEKVYAVDGYFPFTGVHLCIGLQTEKAIIGDIVAISDSVGININETHSFVHITTNKKDKKVYGVISHIGNTITEELNNKKYLSLNHKDFYIEITKDKYTQFSVNALGEGMINVCDDGGDILIGDYICSSKTPGKGMKQKNDILYSYTVAKATEDVIWAEEESSVKMICCTYHCG